MGSPMVTRKSPNQYVVKQPTQPAQPAQPAQQASIMNDIQGMRGVAAGGMTTNGLATPAAQVTQPQPSPWDSMVMGLKKLFPFLIFNK